MSIQCNREDTVPAGYLSLRDGLNVLIEAEIRKRSLAVDQSSEEPSEEEREQYKVLIQKLTSAIKDGLLNSWAWNRKTNQFLRLSTEVFSLQHSDLHFSSAQLFFLGLPNRERFLEDWIGLFEEKQFR